MPADSDLLDRLLPWVCIFMLSGNKDNVALERINLLLSASKELEREIVVENVIGPEYSDALSRYR